jgi:hypothetical protein
MIVVHILGWDKSRAWTDWSGHVKKQLSGLLQCACPSLRLTERKRFAKKIADGAIGRIQVENPKYAESLSHILESTGAAVSITKEEPNQSLEPTPLAGTPRADARVAPTSVVAHL